MSRGQPESNGLSTSEAERLESLIGKLPEGPSLRRYREQAGLTLAEVGDRVGVSKQAVSKWEAANDPGERWPELARVLGVAEPYPAAPFNPEQRRAWFRERNERIAAGVQAPPSGTFGKGVPPKEAA